MRAWTAMTAAIVASLVSGCTAPQEAAPVNATPAAVALSEIPRVGPRAAGDLPLAVRNATGDLEAIVERGYLRVLVAPSRTYFQDTKGQVQGRTVDAASAFEAFLNQRIAPAKVAVAFIEASEDALIRELLDGKGDVAANLLLTFERDDQVAFAKPVRTGIRELVVTGPKEPPLVTLEDVGGRAIHVRKSSDHHASLVRLNDQLTKINRPPARIVIAPSKLTDEDLLEMVNAGKIPSTIADDYIFDLWRKTFDRLAANRDVAVSQDGILAWVTRKDAPQLLAIVNEFFSTHTLGF